MIPTLKSNGFECCRQVHISCCVTEADRRRRRQKQAKHHGRTPRSDWLYEYVPLLVVCTTRHWRQPSALAVTNAAFNTTNCIRGVVCRVHFHRVMSKRVQHYYNVDRPWGVYVWGWITIRFQCCYQRWKQPPARLPGAGKFWLGQLTFWSCLPGRAGNFWWENTKFVASKIDPAKFRSRLRRSQAF